MKKLILNLIILTVVASCGNYKASASKKKVTVNSSAITQNSAGQGECTIHWCLQATAASKEN